MNFLGKDVLVIGTKRSGLAAIELLRKQGARVRAMDSSPLTAQEQAHFARIGVPVVPQTAENIGGATMMVLSPAVPYDLPMLIEARKRGVATIGEVELASYFLRGQVLGITGSNGKTTTTALTGHLLKECGVDCQVGGNIGTAVTALIDSSADKRWNVLELSSFQLEAIEHFRAQVGGCLNVTPDHLDRHHTFEAYANAKARLFETQQAGDFAVLNYEDETCRGFASRVKGKALWFSSRQKVPDGVWLEDERLLWNGEAFMERAQIRLRGLHNVENVMAAALMAHMAGAKLAAIGAAVTTFPGVEHRIEFVRKLDGVEYFNDSKATNVDATLKALDAFPGGVWLILGGKDKGGSYEALRKPLQERAKAVLLIGKEPPYEYAAAPIMRKQLKGAVEMTDCGTLENALAYARKNAGAGDVVLLAPACASFDQFQNYEERGKRFKQIVSELL